MGDNYQLQGYTAHYVMGQPTAAKLLKRLRAVVREIEKAKHQVDHVHVNSDGAIGWSATVFFYAF